MSIIEKAFEKAGSKSDLRQEDELIASINDRLDDEEIINDEDF
jgi:hypothetical protein